MSKPSYSIFTSPIARKLVFALVLCSSIITLIVTAAQLYSDYRQNISSITDHFSYIEKSLIKGISQSVWVLDNVQINLLLEGITQGTTIEYASISVKGGTRWHRGQVQAKRSMEAKYSLTRQHRNQKVTIGILHIRANLDEIYQRLIQRGLFILLSNGLKTLIVSIFIFFIFHFLITKHLYFISRYLQKLDFKKEMPELSLSRSPRGVIDELDQLVLSINEMQENINKYFSLLKSREEELQILSVATEQSPATIVITNLEGTIEYVNPAFEKITGYTAEEAIGQNPRILSSGILPKPFYENLWKTITSGKTWKGEFRNKKKDGSPYWEKSVITPIVTEQGKTIRFMAIKEDISNEKALLEELQEREEKYREIFNAPSEAIYIHNAETGAIIDVNNAMLNMFGFSYEEALNLNVNDASLGEYPYNQEEAEKKIRKAITEGPQTFEWHARKKSGDVFWVEVGLKYTEHRKNRYVIAVVRNIDDRKKAAQTLAEERERLLVTLRSIGDGVITTDIDGRVVLLNEIAEELTGWSNKDAQGKPSHEVFNIINEQTGEKCASPVARVIELGRIIGLANHTALIAKNGTQRSIADSGAPIRDSNSNLIGVVLVFRDVTHEKMMEEELLKSKKLESIGVLAGGIAHDFNNILSAILGNIELARSRIAKYDDETGKLLDSAQKATKRATKLTGQLLTFSKGGDPVKENIFLKNVIIENATFVLHGSKITCAYDIPEDLWFVDADAGQVGQVIQNIVLNAKHAMPEGGTISIHCSNVTDAAATALLSVDQGDFVYIRIKDTGIGIPQNIIDKIFDPYFSTKHDGSGLGLAICHSIINKHNGYLTVDSKTGEGSTFSIFLPAVHEQSLTEAPAQNATKKAIKAATVMIMDDEPMLRELTSQQLFSLGHGPVAVSDGAQAINKYQELQDKGAPVDLVIMDLTIPGGMGGKEAAEKLLRIDPEVKLIVASGYSNDPIMSNYEKYGFCAAIAKPFDLKELSNAIASVM